MNAKQKKELRKFVNELSKYRGRHTELVSVYVPAGYELIKIIQHLQEEQGTAENIKDKTTRNNVIDALERLIRHLKLFKRTSENGLAAFSGNVAEKEGQQDIKVWSIEPPIPLKTRIYRCDQTFVLDLLRELLDINETYGLIVMDNREANIGLLRGTLITQVASLTSSVPGKVKAGGQCVLPDTLVITNEGDIIECNNLHNPYVVKSINFDDYKIVDSNIVDKWNVNKNKAIHIVTKEPRIELICSKDHVLFTFNGKLSQTYAENLKVGDSLLMPEKISVKGKSYRLDSKKYYNSFIINKDGRSLLTKKRKEKNMLQRQVAKSIGLTQTTISYYEIGRQNPSRKELYDLCNSLGINYEKFLDYYTKPKHHQGIKVKLPEVLNDDLAQFLGYFLGDGNFDDERINFSEQSKYVALFYRKKFGKFFNLKVSYKFRKSKNYHQLRFNSSPLVRLIKNEFPELKSKDSRIPSKILKSKDRVLAKFISGLFDAEGYVTKDELSLGMNNKMIIRQLQLALLRLGIIASYCEYDNSKNEYSKKHGFTIRITDRQSLINFSDKIKFASKQKSAKLNKLIKNRTDKSRIRQLLANGSEIRTLIESHGFRITDFPKVSNFFRDERMMSKAVFNNSILNEIKHKDISLYKKLIKYLEINFLPVKIKAINTIPYFGKMIDISVKNQNFIANGLIVHNSQARFARLREEAAHEFYKRIAEIANIEFLGMKELLKGIIIGGPGPTKEIFFNGAYLNNELKKKIIGLKDITYTDEFGLHELVEKSQDLLAKEEIIKEKQLLQKFFEILNKERGKAVIGLEKVQKALEYGAVEILLVSDSVEDDILDSLEEKAEATGAKVEIISTETREGIHLRDIGGVAAILRYAIA